MSGVIERRGHKIVGGKIIYNERPMTWAKADKMAGRRLDRRKNYAVVAGKVCSACTWTDRCSGCSGDDPYDDRGFGCRECGYTGKRVQSYWMPDDGSEPGPTPSPQSREGRR